MAPKLPEPTLLVSVPLPRARAVIFTAGIEMQGAGVIASVSPARLPGAIIELDTHGVVITKFGGDKTLVPWSMVKAVHL